MISPVERLKGFFMATGVDLTDDTAGMVLNGGTGESEVDNARLFVKTGRTGPSSVAAAVVNTGTDQADVRTGTLALDGGGASVGDELQAEADTTTQVGGGDFAVSGGTVQAAGMAALAKARWISARTTRP